jgi:hypothetical protein
MSTPITRNGMLRGLTLYAPKGVVHRSASPDDAAASDNQAPSDDETTSQSEIESNDQAASADPSAGPTAPEQSEGDRPESTESLASRGETEAAAIEEWLAHVIREAMERKQVAENRGANAPQIKGPQPLSIAAGADASADRKPPLPASQQPVPRSPNPPIPNVTPARAVSPRPRRLEPEVVPEPRGMTRRSGVLRPVVRLSLVMIFAALAAYGLIAFSSLQPLTLPLKGDNDRVANSSSIPLQQVQSDTRPPSRLVVENQQAFANEPLSLAVHIEHARSDESLLLDGLAQGSRMSAGAAVSASSWQLPSSALRGLYLYAPKDFVGVMNADVDLLGPDKNVLDSRAVQLKWIAKQPKPVPPNATAIARPTAAGRVDGKGSAAALPTITPITPTIAPIDPDEASTLMQRGRDSLNTGDISAARVAFRRLADAGNADAVLALASTYDPGYLIAHNFLGVQGDRATARALYQRAKQLGSAEAGRILARMVGN